MPIGPILFAAMIWTSLLIVAAIAIFVAIRVLLDRRAALLEETPRP